MADLRLAPWAEEHRDRIHAPNERMVMDHFWNGLLAGDLRHELRSALGARGAGCPRSG